MKKYYIILFSFVLLFLVNGSTDAQNFFYWNEISKANVQTPGERIVTPEKFKVFTLNIPEIKNILNSAPQEKNVQVKNSNVILSLPLPDGGFGRFKIVESPK